MCGSKDQVVVRIQGEVIGGPGAVDDACGLPDILKCCYQSWFGRMVRKLAAVINGDEIRVTADRFINPGTGGCLPVCGFHCDWLLPGIDPAATVAGGLVSP